MHYKRVIPCLDVSGGRVVKGVGFIDLRDAGDPVELAARYDAAGADELVFLDITATSDKRRTVVELARAAADELFIPFTIGGGIRSIHDAQAVLDAGADKVSINSAALARPELIDELARNFGTQCVVLAIDAKRRGSSGNSTVAGAARRSADGGAGVAERLACGRPMWPEGARPPDATPCNGRRREWSGAPARSCSPAWTATAPMPAMTLS